MANKRRVASKPSAGRKKPRAKNQKGRRIGARSSDGVGRVATIESARVPTVRAERELEGGVHSMELLESESSARSAAFLPAAAEGGRYVYGIIEAKDALMFGKMGIGGQGEMVYTVQHGDIASVVSKTNVYIFDPTRENALAHEHVIESVMKSHTIIPMAFGTVFRTDEDIRQVLKSIYASLKDVLKQMEGKVEFGLKVSWERERIIDELKREDEEIHRLHAELTKKHLQSTYFARMQLGRMIDKSLAERSTEFVREIYDGLRFACVASRDNKPIGDKMIMNAAFLIRRDREPDFEAAVNKVARKFGDRLNFKLTGPWPPYNFVNIRLKFERGTTT
ncbi:MAG: GvpL/GvpF family gas vesicle protein [Acidobacteriales bacterium]|nr:GvpL/GvpF family gas vesicle protein [Terriglobales bacterium]